jgi:hypothetical protein
LSLICAAFSHRPPAAASFSTGDKAMKPARVAGILDFNLLDYGKMILNGVSAVRSGLLLKH